ncbi:UNVERIFIED_CONTAM: hypothetical protein FKN15_010932 [Acipenser sinensis]
MCIKAADLSPHPFHLDLSLQNTMKVVLGILVLLHCAAQVQTLSCFTCDVGTEEAICTTKTYCKAGDTSCFSTYTVTGSTITVEKGCKADCVESENPRTFCCSTDNCNVVPLRCDTCPETSDESTCTVSICALSDNVCKTTYEKSGTENKLSCNTCTNEADEPKCAATACTATDKQCQSSYTLTAPVDLLKCYTCTDLTDETNCKDITICGYGDKFCKTTYKLTGTDKFTCFQCAETPDESSCTPSLCAAGTFCQSDYKLNGAGVPVVTKSCAADCKAVDNTADKNVRTTCCKTGYCNVDLLKCYTCTDLTDETNCKDITICGYGDKFCKTTYKLTGTGK